MNVAQERTKSLWMNTPVADAPVLSGDHTADVVIIGSGIAGLSTAYELTARGRSVMVIDRGNIGSGMTARTSAHLVSALDDGYAELIKARGLDVAKIVYQSQAAAISRIESIVARENIDCDFRRLDGYLFLAPETSPSQLDDELAACGQAGVPVDDVREPTPLHTGNRVRSLRFPDQARFHPLKYLAGLARVVTQSGGRLFANTAVKGAVEQNGAVVVTTEKGEVRAKEVVFATNSPIGGSVTIHTKQAPYRTFVIAGLLPRGSLADALYWDTLDPYHYVRLQPHSEHDDTVIIGGEDYKSGEADDGEGRFKQLERWARDRLPQLGEITHRWSGQIMEPIDYLGFLGRNAGDQHRYLITGDSGQGLTNGVIGSLLITQQIVDGTSPWTDAFNPGRNVAKQVRDFVGENLTVLKSFAEYLTGGEIKSAGELKPGEGAILSSGIKKIAACRDTHGALHVHSATCTHMGCVVHWNSLEQCWDCPCHGSQFAPDGSPLNGPAVAPLAPVEQKERLDAAE
jgi:glycine/D-amino acid oxidase-like deaminating enzyme/nitrite reductase/ring-hydroxylating ferredoxin subunit